MREIKFRAWDKVQKIMRCDMLALDVNDAGWKCIFFKEGEYLPQEGAVLMQYTGLKDKNGKEIYEGDVVTKSVPLFQPLGRGQRIDEVVWGRDDKNTGMWELRLILDDRIKRNPENKVPYFEPFGLGCEPHNFEVIGNIYENPELLKDEA